MDILKKLDELRHKDFNIHIEILGNETESTNPYNNDHESQPYYCNLYYGDSNSPWKPGTLLGVGWGYTLEEAVNNANNDLKHPNDRK